MIKSLLLCLIILFSFQTRANFSNYNSIILGEQAAGLGGAAVAMTEDSSAAAWYNPAVLSKLPGQQFSAAVGIYKKFDVRYRDDLDITKTSFRVNQGFFQALPSSTASVIRPEEIDAFKDYTFAFSILVPEFETFKGDIYNEGSSLSTLSLQTQSLWVGGALAKNISSSESLGLSLYYTARSVSKSVSDRTYVSASQSQIFTEERNITQNSVVAIVGYHKDLNEKWQFGSSFRLPSWSVAGDADVTQTTINNGAIQAPVALRSIDTKARIPWKFSTGLAYSEKNNYLLSAQLDTYGAMSYGDVENSDVAERIEHRAISNISLGGEKTWLGWIKGRMGLFSNYSSHPNPNVSLVKGQGDHVDQLGFSANMSVKLSHVEYTFGGYYTGGRGQSVQRVNQNYEVVTKVVNVFTMLVGSSYSF